MLAVVIPVIHPTYTWVLFFWSSSFAGSSVIVSFLNNSSILRSMVNRQVASFMNSGMTLHRWPHATSARWPLVNQVLDTRAASSMLFRRTCWLQEVSKSPPLVNLSSVGWFYYTNIMLCRYLLSIVEKTNLQTHKPGLLTMAADANDGFAGSYFYIVTGSSGQWDYAFDMQCDISFMLWLIVCLGEVIEGMGLLQRINSLASTISSPTVDLWFYPKDVFIISQCGLIRWFS